MLVLPLPSACVVSEARACVCSQSFCVPVSCHVCGSWLDLNNFDSWRRSWPRWQASLAPVEEVVTHGLQCLLESPSWIVAPISSVEQVSPAALLRPRSRSSSPLPKAGSWSPSGSQRGPLVCPSRAAPRLLPTDRSPPTAALAPRPLPLAALSFGAAHAKSNCVAIEPHHGNSSTFGFRTSVPTTFE